MKKVLIIGYGNPLREDDGVGWRVVEEIDNGQIVGDLQSLVNCQLSTVAVHQLLPELAEDVSEAGLVIFVDASVTGEPGTVAVQEIAPVAQKVGAFTHHFDPAGLLGYARDLYGRFPRAYLVTVTAVSLGYGEGLSDTVEAAVPNVLNQIEKLIS
jgi:hydrogenase maturation protease